MNSKIKTIPIEVVVDNLLLKGELDYWNKDYEIRLKEPLQGNSNSHLILSTPVKYVLKKSKHSNCIEIELLEKSKEILKSIYLNEINRRK